MAVFNHWLPELLESLPVCPGKPGQAAPARGLGTSVGGQDIPSRLQFCPQPWGEFHEAFPGGDKEPLPWPALHALLLALATIPVLGLC